MDQVKFVKIEYTAIAQQFIPEDQRVFFMETSISLTKGNILNILRLDCELFNVEDIKYLSDHTASCLILRTPEDYFPCCLQMEWNFPSEQEMVEKYKYITVLIPNHLEITSTNEIKKRIDRQLFLTFSFLKKFQYEVTLKEYEIVVIKELN